MKLYALKGHAALNQGREGCASNGYHVVIKIKLGVVQKSAILGTALA
jgi:hypothetical protein